MKKIISLCTALLFCILIGASAAYANDELDQQLFNTVELDDNLDGVNQLIAEGANVDAVNDRGYTPLHRAAIWGRINTAKVLITHKAEVNAVTKYECTPLHQAALYGHTNVAKILIAHEAKIDAVEKNGSTPLDLAKDQSITEILDQATKAKDDGTYAILKWTWKWDIRPLA